MKPPKISIVVPSLNKARYIGKTISSVVAQKYSNLELIIQDGGSTDGTLQIIKKYAKKYPSIIRFVSKKDKGQLDAINKGMRKTKGEILTYINADDIYCPGSFHEIAKLFLKDPHTLWLVGRGKIINLSGEEIANAVTEYKNLLLSINSRFCLLMTNYLMQPSVFITKKAWKKFGPFTGTSDFVMEYDMWLKISKHEMPTISSRYLSSFRIEPSTITKRSGGKLLFEDERIVRKYTTNPVILFIHKLHNQGRRNLERTI